MLLEGVLALAGATRCACWSARSPWWRWPAPVLSPARAATARREESRPGAPHLLAPSDVRHRRVHRPTVAGRPVDRLAHRRPATSSSRRLRKAAWADTTIHIGIVLVHWMPTQAGAPSSATQRWVRCRGCRAQALQAPATSSSVAPWGSIDACCSRASGAARGHRASGFPPAAQSRPSSPGRTHTVQRARPRVVGRDGSRELGEPRRRRTSLLGHRGHQRRRPPLGARTPTLCAKVAIWRALTRGRRRVVSPHERQLQREFAAVVRERVVAGEAGVAVRLAGRRPPRRRRPARGRQRVAAQLARDLVDVAPVRDHLLARGHVDAVVAGVLDRRRGDAQVDLARAGVAQHLDDLARRVAAHDRVVDDDQPLAGDDLRQRVELQPQAVLAQLLPRLDERARDVAVLDEAVVLRQAAGAREAARRRRCRSRARRSRGRRRPAPRARGSRPSARAPPAAPCRPCASRAARSRCTRRRRRPRARPRPPGASAAPVGIETISPGTHVAQQLGADDVERARLARDAVAVAELAEHSGRRPAGRGRRRRCRGS